MAREGGVVDAYWVNAATAVLEELTAAFERMGAALYEGRWAGLRYRLILQGKSYAEVEAIVRAEMHAEAQEHALKRLEPDRWADDGGPEEPPLYDYGRTPSGQYVRWERR